MPVGTFSQMIIFAIVALTLSCNTGTSLNGSSEKKKSSNDAKTDSKKITSDKSDAKTEAEEDTDDDLSVIPPEVVSAAYLTCSTSDTETSPKEGEIHLGCNITNNKGKRLDVDQEKCKWDIKKKNGEEVEHERIEAPESSKYQRVFGLAKSDYESGVSPTVAVEVSDGSLVVLKRKGVVKINGVEKE
jgi:hypothetical protein